MSLFASLAVVLWSAPFVWFCVLIGSALICGALEHGWDEVSIWWTDRRLKREADTQAADDVKE